MCSFLVWSPDGTGGHWGHVGEADALWVGEPGDKGAWVLTALQQGASLLHR